MDRIQEIEQRKDRRKELMTTRKNEFAMHREVEYQKLTDYTVDDIEYLLAENKRYREALEKIIEHVYYANCHWCGDKAKEIAEDAKKPSDT